MQSVALFSVASAWTAALPSSYAPVQYTSQAGPFDRLGNLAFQTGALLSLCGLGALAGFGLRRAQTALAVGGEEADGMRPMSLKGKKAFIAGIGDDQGYGWAIAHALAEEGCEIIIGT